jgi:hypothetical protein
MADPKFVRLADHMVHGLLVDMESGWKISGYDVKEFPENSEQARFVKRNIQQGKLEPAGKAEFDEIHPEDDSEENAEATKFAAAVQAASSKKNAGVQEHEIQQKVAERQAAVRKARAQAKREERNENARSSRGGRRVRPAAAEEESEA